MKFQKTGLLIAILTLMLFLTYGCQSSSQSKQNSSSYNHSHTATLFLHGYGGSANSEKYMVQQAVNHGVTNQVITAIVDKNGDITFKGKLAKNAINPIVKIELKDNKNGNVKQNASHIKNVLTKLKNDFHIKQYNFVAHSMGNLSFAYFMKLYGQDTQLPQLNKEVNIAGTFNGVLNLNEKVNEISVDKNGKPSKMTENYQQLLGLKNNYKDKQIDVLNIYGDIQDGTHSDGRVSNSSSKSLKYLLADSPKSYKESQYTGATAQHSQLHENNKVANEIIQFLWKKS
ncbi:MULTISPECIES: alpha/beta hydrolase [Staphylococcus]|uniref:Alpha/beta hydrolase n=1 Tax=Staphylococcus lugdunensis TaxID=28035 RepID=A0ABD4EIK0_STALU|nr:MULTISPECIES: alpha/beta hydrolase [Staphylococcus]ADC86980.1 putative cell surface hydrolase [Staphylococcus lugdunensis HKU09-01]ARJ08712.1 alpha/beta hydrolase [Staphylococcus lugdunensis]ARJ13445.1 alpha/beta hydrolase [Staphylococcus lugdunensis]ARJ15790.1 alpha/beta hydrolase [Staphylococcus lugdunensis]ARJ26946.1 alpha/beta hydrolase [Staphylococcus lugdunensis]